MSLWSRIWPKQGLFSDSHRNYSQGCFVSINVIIFIFPSLSVIPMLLHQYADNKIQQNRRRKPRPNLCLVNVTTYPFISTGRGYTKWKPWTMSYETDNPVTYWMNVLCTRSKTIKVPHVDADKINCERSKCIVLLHCTTYKDKHWGVLLIVCNASQCPWGKVWEASFNTFNDDCEKPFLKKIFRKRNQKKVAISVPC